MKQSSFFTQWLGPLLFVAAVGLVYNRFSAMDKIERQGEPTVSGLGVDEHSSSTLFRRKEQPPGSIGDEASGQGVADREVGSDDVPVLAVSLDSFSPVRFQMAAISHLLPLSRQRPSFITRIPDESRQSVRFGELRFASGLTYALMLDANIDGYRLYVDLNANGDLSDDGPPLSNKGSGLFASTLLLPLDRVSGRRSREGDYDLWIYSGHKERPPASLSYYARTQLKGEVRVAGVAYSAFLADNYRLDGDFSNDGISLDLDRNGRIDLETEYFPPNSVAILGNSRYRFKIGATQAQ